MQRILERDTSSTLPTPTLKQLSTFPTFPTFDFPDFPAGRFSQKFLRGNCPPFFGQKVVDFCAIWQNMVINDGLVLLVALSRNMLYFAKFNPFWAFYDFMVCLYAQIQKCSKTQNLSDLEHTKKYQGKRKSPELIRGSVYLVCFTISAKIASGRRIIDNSNITASPLSLLDGG